MKECDNSTRKIHISSNFILSITLLLMFDTLLLRPSLHCNTPLHFTTFHPTPLHYTYRHFTSSHLHFTTLSFSFTHLRIYFELVRSTRLLALPALQPRLSRHLPINLLVSKAADDILGCQI